jgi:hypothetical protein
MKGVSNSQKTVLTKQWFSVWFETSQIKRNCP